MNALYPPPARAGDNKHAQSAATITLEACFHNRIMDVEPRQRLEAPMLCSFSRSTPLLLI